MVFSGCSITYGTAVAVVTATGMDTEMGKIANLLEGADDGQTPLQKRLAQLGKYLGILALAACAIIFVVGLANGLEVMEIFMTSVSLAVSAIPEGLPVIVTIVLSIGVQRMVKKNALNALGSFYGLGQSVASLLKEKANIDATLINPRYITGVDNELMDELKADHELVITLEDGVLDGGFGEKITRYYGATNMKVLNFGAKKEFVDRYDIQEFLRANHLTDEQIVEDITAVIG